MTVGNVFQLVHPVCKQTACPILTLTQFFELTAQLLQQDSQSVLTMAGDSEQRVTYRFVPTLMKHEVTLHWGQSPLFPADATSELPHSPSDRLVAQIEPVL